MARHFALLFIVALSGVSLSSAPRLQFGKRASLAAGQSLSFGPVNASIAGGRESILLPFSLPISKSLAGMGYKVTATSNFIFIPAMSAAGGKSISASDIQIGITNFSSSVATTAIGSSDATVGAARITLADLLSGREVLRAEKTASATASRDDVLALSVKLSLPHEFFTPGSFSGTIRLIVSP